MINKVIEEIRKSLDNGCPFAALSLSLILIDSCAKIEFPELGNKKRYIAWYDRHLTEKPSNGETSDYHFHGIENLPEINGETIYSLRCSVLHEGNPKIEEKYIPYFELLYQEKIGARYVYYTVDYEGKVNKNGQEEFVAKKMCINLRTFCERVCKTVEIFYKERSENFNFKYNIVNMDYHTRKMMIGQK